MVPVVRALIDLPDGPATFTITNGAVIASGPPAASLAAELAQHALDAGHLPDSNPGELAEVLDHVIHTRPVSHPAVLTALAHHPDPQVRIEVTGALDIPRPVLVHLAHDPDETVATAATQVLTGGGGYKTARWMLTIPVFVFVALIVVLVGMAVALAGAL